MLFLHYDQDISIRAIITTENTLKLSRHTAALSLAHDFVVQLDLTHLFQLIPSSE